MYGSQRCYGELVGLFTNHNQTPQRVYSRNSSMVQTCEVWLPSPVDEIDESMLFTQWCLRQILGIAYTAHVTNDEVRTRTYQPPATHDQTASFILALCLSHPTRDHSTVTYRTGNARHVDQDEPGSIIRSQVRRLGQPGARCRAGSWSVNSSTSSP